MMETAAQKEFCKSCGVDVRPDTLFCYNCGKSVAPEAATSEKSEATVLSNVWFQDKPIGAKPAKEKIPSESEEVETTTQVEEIDEKKSLPVGPSDELLESKEIQKTEPESETKSKAAAPGSKKPELRSAASIRPPSRQIRKQVVEVNWEEPKVTSGSWYFFAAVLTAIFAIGLLLTMLTIH